MGLTKTDIFNEKQNRLAGIFKVLGHPARIAILQQIIERQQCINAGLVEDLGLAQATISQHLQELKKSGLIRGNISGNSMFYCINDEVWKEVKNEICSFLDSYNGSNSSC